MSREYLIRLPWPPASLSPNARGHWSAKAKAASRYRGEARLLAQAMGCRALAVPGLSVEVIFYPPDYRRRDTDNMLASVKSGLDGISDATGVDDSNWRIGLARGEPVEGGAVLVHVKPEETDNWQSIGALASDMVKGSVS